MNIRKKISIGIIIILIISNFIFVPINNVQYILDNNLQEFDSNISLGLITNMGLDRNNSDINNKTVIVKKYNYKLVVLIDFVLAFISILLLTVVFKPKNEKVM